MSFRIENILKKEATCKSDDEHHKATLKDEAKGFKSAERGDIGSILHRTLSNRLPPQYYKPGGENYPIDSRASPSVYSYGCHRLCYPQSYYNLYYDNDYQHLYPKNRFYPMCIPSPVPTIYPLQYNYYSKRKGGQVRFTANQTDILEKQFLSRQYLSPEDRKTLAEKLKLSDRQVKTWFQNRRAKSRRSSSSCTEHSTDCKKEVKILKTATTKRDNVNQ